MMNIYEYIKENFEKEVNEYIFKRDYIRYPLKKITNTHGGLCWEKPYSEDLCYLYITLNLMRKDIGQLLKTNDRHIKRLLKTFNIKKDRKKIFENTELVKLKKYGNKYYTNIEKVQRTMNERYGVKAYSQTKEFLVKASETCIKKYGVSNYSLSSDYKDYNKKHKKSMVDKMLHTKRKNKTFKKSQPEEIIFDKLKQRYKIVKRQYKSGLYPFSCDFYIPKNDLYIEYNGHWTHGFEPYIGTKEQLQKVKLWESKSFETYMNGRTKTSYNVAIDVWTNRDVLKRNTAKQNNLNYLEFFNMDEFNEWYEKNDIVK